MIDFAVPPELQQLADRTAAFVREEIVPYENDARWGAHGPSDELRRELNARARAAGLLAPHASKHWGGLGLGHLGRALVFEQAGYSMLGPIALHCQAPDEGNVHMLEVVASPAQQERFLAPLARAETRSCFCMTEPRNGAGSDPELLATTAVRDGDDYLISGRKWLITGAQGAAFAIIMAKVEGAGATMFLSDMDAPGIRIERVLDSLDSSFVGGHVEMSFDRLRVPADQVLGEVGQGLRYAQVRLAPARLTHCMRWLGSARRAQDIAVAYARERRGFGKTIGEHEGIGFQLADNEIDLQMCRLVIWQTAWLLDQGKAGRHESSIAKVFCSEAIWRIVDRCMQVLGGMGLTRDTVVERIFRDVRAFRVYDGPNEVHRFAIARRVLGKAAA